MLSAGSGSAVHLDGFTAGGLAAHRAMSAARLTVETGATGSPRADLAFVFAGARHGDDEFRGLLSAVERTTRADAIVGCSATGVLTETEEIEDSHAVVVLVVAGGELPSPLIETGIRSDPRATGRRLGETARAQLGHEFPEAALALLIDPEDLDATALLAGIAEAAPGLTVVGAGASGGESGARLFFGGSARKDTAVALALPRSLRPTAATSHACQGVSEPMLITAAEGNQILEIDGRYPIDVLNEMLERPGNRPLGRLAIPLLAGIGERTSDGRADYVVRPFLVPDDDPRTLAVPEPIRVGQTIRFALRDAIGAREDMKAMLEEQVAARGDSSPAFGLYFNCAGRGSALYGRSGLDPELIHRRFERLPLAGLETSFEIAPACGRTRVHMFTGVLLLAG